jgi:hypothetical protein
MTEPVTDRLAMIRGMDPDLRPGRFVFCTVPEDSALLADALGSFHEDGALSLLLPLDKAAEAGLPVDVPMREITLRVQSSLLGVGLTAAVAGALAEAGIPCNMVAATRHDHVFVPEDRAETALALLLHLARTA